jgi:hypothetical protein
VDASADEGWLWRLSKHPERDKVEQRIAMWFLLQGSIVFAVMSANICWQITPNGYLASLVGIGLAFFATVAVNQLLLWTRQKRSKASIEKRT